jgi:hypothetical protein
MWRISKESYRIKSLKRGDYDIDSIIIIPGVSTYENIYTKQNLLYFSNNDYNKSIAIEFISEGDLDRFFAQMMRENKINQILGDYKGGGSSS